MLPSNGKTSAPLRPHPLAPEGIPGSLSADIPNDSSDDISSCPSINLDSIGMRRRHGEYFHRPPVWFPRPCSYGTSSATSGSDEDQPEKRTVQHTHQSDEMCPSCSAGLDVHGFHRCSSPSDLTRGKESPDQASGWDPSASTLANDGNELDLARPATSVSVTRWSM